MTGVVICKKFSNRTIELCLLLEKEKRYPFKVVLIDKILEEGLPNCNFVAVDWELRYRLFGILQKKPEMGILFFNNNVALDLDDIFRVKKIIREAKRSENWKLCKVMNEFMLYGDVIRHRSKINAFPRKFQLETTDLCNAKCIMCSHAYSVGSGLDIFESGILKKLDPYLPYVRTIVLHGNGEPFIKKNIVQYLDYLTQYDISFVTNTNLSILNDEILKRLNNNFEEISVSCDAHYKELYESIRIGLNFEMFVKNVIRVREHCPQLHMNMAVVVMRQNLPYLDKIVGFAADLGFQEVQFNQLCVDPKCNNLKDTPILYQSEYIEAMNKAILMAKKRQIIVRYPNITEIKNEKKLNAEKFEDEIVFEGICDWLVGSPFINLRGDVGICCINSRYLMGNVFKNNFGEIWNSEPYCAIREDFYRKKMNEICRGCDFMMQGRLQFLKLISADITTLQKNIRDQ